MNKEKVKKNKTSFNIESDNQAIVMVPIDQIEDFSKHPFKVRDDEKMQELVASINKNGVLMPAIIRPTKNNTYEMISGHRRKRACEIANKKEIPCIIRNLTDDEATILMVDSNIQREEIMPSERAYAYKMKLEALKHQGKKVKETSTPVEEKLSIDIIAEEFGQRREQVRRYIRLTELNSELLEMVNEKKIAIRPAIQISYLKPDEQYILLDVIEENLATPSEKQAKDIRKLSEDGKITKDIIEEIIQEEKPNQKMKYTINYERFEKYLPRNIVTIREVEDFLLMCVKKFFESQISNGKIKKDK